MSKPNLFLALIVGFLVNAGALFAEPIFPFEVHKHTLDNGLQAIAIPYDSPGIVTYMTVVRTGSRNEVEAGHTGFAHFFEHMMFRGTDRYSTEAYQEELKRMGADSNASTSDDWTRYHITGPSARLATMIELEADRFLHLKYSEDGFRTEARAVLGEYNKNSSNPFRAMNERLRELAFSDHTYRHTTMGFVADIEAMPGYYEYSLGFFERFYRPENCIVVAVGDVEPGALFEEIDKNYGGWKPGFDEPAVPSEGAPKGSKRDAITWPNPTRPFLMMGFLGPAFSATARESASLDVISELLFSETAPLYRRLVVEEQSVDILSGGLGDHRDPYLFTVTARAKSDDLLPQVESAIREAIAVLQQTPIEAERLDQIKSHMRYRFALGLDSPSAIAFTVAHYLSLTGSVETINEIYERYDEVGPEDVQATASKYFTADRETVVVLSHPAS